MGSARCPRPSRRLLCVLLVLAAAVPVVLHLRSPPPRHRDHLGAPALRPVQAVHTNRQLHQQVKTPPPDGGHDRAKQAWVVDTEGCRIPHLDANSSEVAPFVADYELGACDDPPPLVRSTDTTLFVDSEALAAYGVRSPSELRCCYTPMWRVRPNVTVADWRPGLTLPPPHLRKGPLYDGVSYGNDIRFGERCEPFFKPTVVAHEFVRANCAVFPAGKGVSRHVDYHAFVPVKAPRGHKGGVGDARLAVSDNSLNVLIVGVDSVSRLNFIRTMPKTRAFLEQHLGLQGMLGYNKVEDNTFPNLIPLLSGMSVPELRKACWGDAEGSTNNAHFDACPWIWKRFNEEGYVNMFSEDTSWMGLFHYYKKGFIQQPTDYDPRPLLFRGETDLARKKNHAGTPVCVGQRYALDVLFDYGLKFASVMRRQRRKFFGIVWGTSLSHDSVNSPVAADEMYARFLADLEATGVLNNTALVFMSDHGLRFGDILTTRQGRLEEKLPLMYVSLPGWVLERYPQAARNLHRNKDRLVTVYDLHVTMHDLMHLSSLETPRQVSRPYPRGLSMFTPIPPERTCDAAGIPKHYCACQEYDDAPTDEHRVTQVAEFLLAEVNAQLQASPLRKACWQLSLDAVQDVRGGPLRTRGGAVALEHVYELVVRARPGGALLSATVVYRLGTATMKLDGTVSRIDHYGAQGWCMTDFKLKMFCHCKRSLPTADSDIIQTF
ncbi:uncharacterized protein LOC113211922 [Frankliniella occidentalis]|uniref:Uncharacterized protein LOC113211922 n=1 Tax=Frankliniella occidentalis TaxID=133901 RepID=A0A6J1T3Q5_FRAOC|nr:uncharacterized protein LOC113211922 [Frankliniella occidentalis]